MTSDPTARLAEFLSIGDTRLNLPNVRIRDAATMLVIDRTGPSPRCCSDGAITATSSCRENSCSRAAESSWTTGA